MAPPEPSQPSRRQVLIGGTALLGSLAGCAILRSESSRERTGRTTTATHTRTRPTSRAETASTTPSGLDALQVHVSPVEFGPVVRFAAAWNVNAGPAEHPHPSDVGVNTELNTADYFAARRGIDPTGERGRPPFPVAVGRADPRDNAWMLGDERIDLAGTGLEPTSAESLRLSRRADWEEFDPHVVAKGGRQIVVARDVSRGGVPALTPAEIRAIYAGEATNWREFGGPDREIRLFGVGDSTPNRPFKRRFLDNGSEAGVDEVVSRARPRLRAVRKNGGGITDVDVGRWETYLEETVDGVRPLDVLVDGHPVEGPALAYPSVYGVPLFSKGASDAREEAFLDGLLSSYGQRFFEGYYEAGSSLLPVSE